MKAQELLNQVHEIGIPHLYEPALTVNDRKASIKLAKQKLNLIQKTIKQETSRIKAQYDGRNQVEAILERDELAPYEVLENLIDRLEISLSELELNKTGGEPPPIGEYLIEISGNWRITGAEGLVEKRLSELRHEISITKELLGQAQANLQRLSMTLSFTGGCVVVGFVVAIIMLLVFLGGPTYTIFGREINSLPLCSGLMILFLIWAVIFGRHRIPNQATTRQQLRNARKGILRLEKALEITSVNSQQLEQYESYLRKIQEFAERTAKIRY